MEIAPGAPGGSWFLCSFLYLFRRSSEGGVRLFQGPQRVPGFSARSFTCFGGHLKVVGGSSTGSRFSTLCSAPWLRNALFRPGGVSGKALNCFSICTSSPLSAWLQIGFFLPFPLGETSGAFCHRAGALSWLPCRALLCSSPLSLFVRFLVLFRPLSFFFGRAT